jgi:hypothetical protein
LAKERQKCGKMNNTTQVNEYGATTSRRHHYHPLLLFLFPSLFSMYISLSSFFFNYIFTAVGYAILDHATNSNHACNKALNTMTYFLLSLTLKLIMGCI